MEYISQRVAEIQESETLAMTKRARELKESGKDIISLSIGEPDMDTPWHICEAANLAMKNGFTHYPPVLGLLPFREAICRKLKNENNLDYKPNQIIVSNGAKHSIINAVLAVVNPGDEVIIPTPFWVSYPSMVEFAKGKCVFVNTSLEQDFKPSAEQIENAITPKTKLLIFSSPTNPSGSVWTKQELMEIAKVLEKHPQILVIADEIYEKIIFDQEHVSFASLPGMYERTATVNGLAKGYAMTGWRIGYLAAANWWVAACEKMQGLFTSGANSISQMAGIAALEGDTTPLLQMKDTFFQRKNRVLELLKEIPNLKFNNPQGAFYVFPDVSYYLGGEVKATKINTVEELCFYLLDDCGVATVAGTAFGNSHCIRISYATDIHSIETAFLRLKESFSKISVSKTL